MKTFIFILLLLMFSLLCFAESEIPERPKVGLVLSGGGARGLAHVGVLKVLEETGIEIDYITGTSMGSIVGGLYAIGYRADELEKLVLEQDWDELLYDKISRRSISIEEKEDKEKFIGSFLISGTKISLPKGLIAGQKVSNLISGLMLSVHHIEDFDQLPIPFYCIATNISTGEPVVLKDGFLPDAIRASMSIPSVFIPIDINGELLVDGGLVRNLPVCDVKEMGAEIVIGVDVGSPLYSKQELNTLVEIMNQAVSFQSVESTINERKQCDILIIPDINEYNIMSFDSADSLITRGERSAREILPQLQILVDSLKNFPEHPKPIPNTRVESLSIEKIYIQGLRDVSSKLVRGKLQLKDASTITPEELELAINRVYGSGFFERVTYKLEPVNNKYNLFVRIIEKATNYFSVGLHYDSDLKSAVYLNTTFRNLFTQGSKLSVDLKLSDNLGLESSYFIYTGWKPGFGFGVIGWTVNFDALLYDETGKLEASYDYTSTGNSIELRTIFSNSFSIIGGIQYANTKLKPIIVPDYYPDEISTINLLNFYSQWKVDTYDHAIFPRKGVNLFAEIKAVNEVAPEQEKHESFQVYTLDYTEILQLHKRVSLKGTMIIGSVKGGDIIPSDYLFYLGGLNNIERRSFPFYGFEFMKIQSKNIAVLRNSLQFELLAGKFVTLSMNFARTGEYFDDIYKEDNNYHGYGISFGTESPIGPIDYTLMKGSESKELLHYFRINYQF